MLKNTKGGHSKLLQALNSPSRRPAQGSKQSSFLSMQKDTFVNFHHIDSAKKHPKEDAKDWKTTCPLLETTKPIWLHRNFLQKKTKN